jgi:hypothetical protein
VSGATLLRANGVHDCLLVWHELHDPVKITDDDAQRNVKCEWKSGTRPMSELCDVRHGRFDEKIIIYDGPLPAQRRRRGRVSSHLSVTAAKPDGTEIKTQTHCDSVS